MFSTIEIDKNNLTIMGVQFSDLKTLEVLQMHWEAICLKVLNLLLKELKSLEIIWRVKYH